MSLDDAETETIRILGRELSRHGELSLRTYNFINLILNEAPQLMPLAEVPPSRLVCDKLLVRVANDLRTMTLLSMRGYGTQALCLGASMYEAANAVAAVGDDDEIAKQWQGHTNKQHSFWGAEQVTHLAVKKWGFAEAQKAADWLYAVYRNLCLPKHLNPLFQAHRGHLVREGAVICMTGPDASELGVKDSWYAVQLAIGLGDMAAAGYILDHVDEDKWKPLLHKAMEILREFAQLDENARTRWGQPNAETVT
jgi:hypothetical protein